jgi:hypothetical protein
MAVRWQVELFRFGDYRSILYCLVLPWLVLACLVLSCLVSSLILLCIFFSSSERLLCAVLIYFVAIRSLRDGDLGLVERLVNEHPSVVFEKFTHQMHDWELQWESLQW